MHYVEPWTTKRSIKRIRSVYVYSIMYPNFSPGES